MLLKKTAIIFVVFMLVLSSVAFAVIIVKNTPGSRVSTQDSPTTAPPKGSFEFVSEFSSGENFSNYGWLSTTSISGSFITDQPNYFGEPSLAVGNGSTLLSNRNITGGDQSVSFQFAVYARNGSGTFAITNYSGEGVLSILVSGTNISINALGSSSNIERSISVGSIVDNGWILVTGNLFVTNQTDWTAQLFVGKTISVFANISVPFGGSYAGIKLNTSKGVVYFTNIIFTSYRMAVFLPGYNNMEGYGQGSGFLVNLLHPFTVLHSDFNLSNWSVPTYATLSFQMNAMNLSGAENQTANGFFQLGIDLDPNGRIAPWYVGGKYAIATYFKNHPSSDFMPGFTTPNNTALGLTIQYLPSEKLVLFQIVDYTVTGEMRYWNASVPYDGPEFCSAYTQIETSSMSASQLSEYRFNGSMSNISYGSDITNLIPFNNSYMLPFSVDTPSTWSLTYYNDGMSGYRQVD